MWRSRTSLDRGAAAVEFALVVPFLLLLVFGVIDFSRALTANVSATHAAREGVRQLALGNALEDAEERALSAFDVNVTATASRAASPPRGTPRTLTSCGGTRTS